jgi:hypothetical protein
MALILSGDTGPSFVQSAAMPAGSVLQVVSASKTDTFSTTSSSFVDVTGLSLSITPSSASSKIMIFVAVPASAGDNGFVSVFKNGVNMYPTNGDRTPAMLDYYYGGSWQGSVKYGNMMYLDSPATTSSITYNIKAKSNGSATIRINEATDGSNSGGRAAMISSITVMEIAG